MHGYNITQFIVYFVVNLIDLIALLIFQIKALLVKFL